MRRIIMSLVALGFLTAPMLMLQGCSDTKGASDARGDTTVTNTTIDSGGGDVTINDVEVTGEGTYVYNENGTVTYSTGDDFGQGDVGTGDTDGDGVPDVEVGVYDDAYDQAECTASGFFYCTLENKCLDQPASGGTCSSVAVMSLYTY